VAALSGPVDPERLQAGLDGLRRLGFEPVPAANLGSRRGFLAGQDAERLDAFHRLAADPTVKAILFARGGHGLLRILGDVDWSLLARHPRAYMGYSDLTPFLHEVVRRLGLVAFHGPLVAGDLARGLDPEEEASFLGALAGRYPVEIPFAGWVREGSASGPLLGGCLSLIAATLGTPFAPDLEGAIVTIEDVNEPPYRIDRLLTHLRLSGTLSKTAGMIVGHLDGKPKDAIAGGSMEGSTDWPAMLGESLDGFAWPLAWGLPSGHVAPNWTLPLGLAARLEAGSRHLVIDRSESEG
jgi:muramoyltetrapeptide carboxypeptidase